MALSPSSSRGATSSGAMTLIDDQTLGSAAAGITFSSIPQTYNHLLLVVNARSAKASVNDWLSLRLNGDTGANYLAQTVNAAGGSASGNETLAAALVAFFQVPAASDPADQFGAARITIPAYRSGVKKSAVAEFFSPQNVNTGTMVAAASGQLWTGQVAITSITVMSFTAATNLIIGSRATLYGLT
jgi:hypothetical protein